MKVMFLLGMCGDLLAEYIKHLTFCWGNHHYFVGCMIS